MDKCLTTMAKLSASWLSSSSECTLALTNSTLASTGLKSELGQVERRLTASTHLKQGLVAHMASLHESMDHFRATTVAFERRLAAVEAR